MACDPDQAQAALRLLFDNYSEAHRAVLNTFGVPPAKQIKPVCVACATYAHEHGEVELRGYVSYNANVSWNSQSASWDDAGDCFDEMYCGHCGELTGVDPMRWVPVSWCDGDALPEKDFEP